MLPPITLVSGLTRVSKAVIVNHDTGVETPVGVESATVVIDRKAGARRVVDATITPDVDPVLLTAPHRLKLWSGFRVGGTDYLASMAHVRIGGVSRGPKGLWELSGCASFESLVAAARFGEPVTAAGGTSMMTQLVDLITSSVNWATVRVETTRDALFPASGQTFETERWDAVAGRAESIATALGVDVFCDGDGVFVIRDAGTYDGVWEAPSGPGGLTVDWQTQTDPSSVVNVWVCHSDNRDAQVRGMAMDQDPYSPTRVARWGYAVQYQSSPLYTAQWQCEQAAQTFLAGSRGLRVALNFRTVPNPWQDVTTQVATTISGQRVVNSLDRIQLGWKAGEATSCAAAARTVSVA